MVHALSRLCSVLRAFLAARSAEGHTTATTARLRCLVSLSQPQPRPAAPLHRLASIGPRYTLAVQAADSRDALCKFVYAKMFDWLVQRINRAMGEGPFGDMFIGILDIFGFEIFEDNSCERRLGIRPNVVWMHVSRPIKILDDHAEPSHPRGTASLRGAPVSPATTCAVGPL